MLKSQPQFKTGTISIQGVFKHGSVRAVDSRFDENIYSLMWHGLRSLLAGWLSLQCSGIEQTAETKLVFKEDKCE